MSTRLFGTQRGLLTYASAELAVSAIPNFRAPGKEPARAWFTQVITAVAEVNQVVVEIAAGAEALPTPPQPQTLQDLVQAGRVRLKKERARKDRDAWSATLDHVSVLEKRLRP